MKQQFVLSLLGAAAIVGALNVNQAQAADCTGTITNDQNEEYSYTLFQESGDFSAKLKSGTLAPGASESIFYEEALGEQVLRIYKNGEEQNSFALGASEFNSCRIPGGWNPYCANVPNDMDVSIMPLYRNCSKS
ncbi:MAG: hypothetical protein AB8B94_16675 [Hyphomicrobiales bacterium]